MLHLSLLSFHRLFKKSRIFCYILLSFSFLWQEKVYVRVLLNCSFTKQNIVLVLEKKCFYGVSCSRVRSSKLTETESLCWQNVNVFKCKGIQ